MTYVEVLFIDVLTCLLTCLTCLLKHPLRYLSTYKATHLLRSLLDCISSYKLLTYISVYRPTYMDYLIKYLLRNLHLQFHSTCTFTDRPPDKLTYTTPNYSLSLPGLLTSSRGGTNAPQASCTFILLPTHYTTPALACFPTQFNVLPTCPTQSAHLPTFLLPLPTCPSFYLSTLPHSLPIYLSVFPVYLCLYSICFCCLAVCIPVYLYTCLSTHLPVCLCTFPCSFFIILICLSIF